MNILQALILGVVEGVTEFLPVSSTFHLIFASKFLGLQQTDFVKVFEVFIQGGAILSVIALYLNEIIKDKNLIKKTLVSFIPTALVGFVLYKVIKNVFFNADYLMLGVFVMVGMLFIALEFFIHKKKILVSKSIDKLTYKDALLVGLVQALAVIPGVSRAGAVIIGLMMLGHRRDEAAKYSFMLAVPTILAASGYDLFKMRNLILHQQGNVLMLAIGAITAFVSSYIVIKWFIGFLKNNSLSLFGYYRFVLAIILLLTGKV